MTNNAIYGTLCFVEQGRAERDAELDAADAAYQHIAETVGGVLKARREFLRLTQTAAAATADISPTTWGGVERGKTPEGRHGITLLAIDATVKWPAGTMARLLQNGVDPREAEALVGMSADRLHGDLDVARPAAFAGLELPRDLTTEEMHQIQGYVDGVLARRRRRG